MTSCVIITSSWVIFEGSIMLSTFVSDLTKSCLHVLIFWFGLGLALWFLCFALALSLRFAGCLTHCMLFDLEFWTGFGFVCWILSYINTTLHLYPSALSLPDKLKMNNRTGCRQSNFQTNNETYTNTEKYSICKKHTMRNLSFYICLAIRLCSLLYCSQTVCLSYSKHNSIDHITCKPSF